MVPISKLCQIATHPAASCLQKAWQVNGNEYEPNSRVFEVDVDIIKEAADEQPTRKKLTRKPPRRKRGTHDLEGLADALAGIIDEAPPSTSKSEVKPKASKQSVGAGTSKSFSKSKGNSCVVGEWQLLIQMLLECSTRWNDSSHARYGARQVLHPCMSMLKAASGSIRQHQAASGTAALQRCSLVQP
jgi:hypothetical protein